MTGRTRLILVIVAGAIICLLFFFLLIRGQQGELGTVRDDIEAAENQTLSLQSELTRLKDLQERAPQLQAQLAEIRQQVPQGHQVPNFIFQVQDAADRSGVGFVRIRPELPKSPPEGAALAEVRVEIGAEGGYFSVQDFIRRLYSLDRALRIDRLEMNAVDDPETGATSEAVTLVCRIFFEVPGATGTATTGTAPAVTTTPAPGTSP